ncbi:MAG: hypothetical protein KIG85_02045 [Thiopseudomonas sp.]|nr:hypothetical protein [Thiopseudomonas sp.]
MLIKLLIAAAVAFFAAGIAQYARILTRKKLPRWIVPAAAGLGILGYQIYMEYSWFERTRARLPDSAVVTEVRKVPAFWRPWTFVVPLQMGFSVVDSSQIQLAHSDGERIARFRLYSFEQAFIDRSEQRGYLLNCSNSVLVPLDDAETPQPEKALQLDRKSQLFTTVCN